MPQERSAISRIALRPPSGWRKAYALTLTIALTATSVPAVPASVWAAATTPNPQSAEHTFLTLVKGDRPVFIPEELGDVIETWQPADRAPDGLVFHIQDLHTHPEAQRHISEIIGYLQQEFGVELVAVEGADGPSEIRKFLEVPDPSTIGRIARLFVQEGLFTGAEQRALMQPDDIELWGVEDRTLYLQQDDAFQHSAQINQFFASEVGRLSAALRARRHDVYPGALLQLLVLREAYENQSDDEAFPAYFKELQRVAKAAKIEMSAYPMLQSLAQSYGLYARISLPVVEASRTRLLRMLRKRLTSQERHELARLDEQRASRRIAERTYYERLAELAAAHGLDFAPRHADTAAPAGTQAVLAFLSSALGLRRETFQPLREYLRYLRLMAETPSAAVNRQLEALEAAVERAYLTSAQQRKLAQLLRQVETIAALSAVRLSPQQYEAYAADRASFTVDTMWAALEDVLGSAPGLTREQLGKLLDALPACAQFYELAKARDEALAKNTLAQLRDRRPPMAILVTGGFHTPGVTQYFKSHGIAYLVITPTVTQAVDERTYRDRLSGVLPPIEELIRKFEAQAFAPGLSADADLNPARHHATYLRELGLNVWAFLRRSKDALTAVRNWFSTRKEDGLELARTDPDNLVLRDHGQTVTFNSLAESEAVATLKEEPAHFQAELRKDAPSYGPLSRQGQHEPEAIIEAIAAEGVKIQRDGVTVTVDRQLLEQGLSEGELGSLLEQALARLRAEGRTPPTRPLTLALLDHSTHLFEDHTANGFIGINQAVLTFSPRHRDVALLVGLTHELRHEAAGPSADHEALEAGFTALDVGLTRSLLSVQELPAYRMALGEIVDQGAYLSALERVGVPEGSRRSEPDSEPTGLLSDKHLVIFLPFGDEINGVTRLHGELMAAWRSTNRNMRISVLHGGQASPQVGQPDARGNAVQEASLPLEKTGVLAYGSYDAVWRQLEAWDAQRPIDAIVLQSAVGDGARAMVDFGNAHGIPVRVWVHFGDLYLEMVETLRRATSIATVSEDMRRSLASRRLTSVILPPFVDLAFWSPDAVSEATVQRLRQEQDIPPDALVVLAAGTLSERKNLAQVLDWVEGVQRSWSGPPIVVAFATTGASFQELEQVRRVADALRVSIRFLGPLSQQSLREWYRAADLFVVPSQSETLGRVAIEAQAMGTAVMVSRAGGLPETVDPHEGVAVHLVSWPQAVETLRRLLSDRAYRERVAAAGQVFVKRKYGYDHRAEIEQWISEGTVKTPVPKETTTEEHGRSATWLEQHTPQLKGKLIVEVAGEWALSDELFAQLEQRLREETRKAQPSLSEDAIDQIVQVEMRKAAMATSVGGIGPLTRERLIAQGQLGANVIGTGLLYDKVWVQKPQPDGTMVQEEEKVTPYLRQLLIHDRDLQITMYSGGDPVTVKVWRAPPGSYGEGTMYFFDIPHMTDVIGGRANVVYPGGRDAQERAEEARRDQEWILGRATLALLKALNQRPDLVIMSETFSMFAHHRLFQDEFSDDPLFAGTRYVYNDHTPLLYAHPKWDIGKLRWLEVDPRYYEGLAELWDHGQVDVTAMLINAADGVFGVSPKHGDVMRHMSSLLPFKDKIQTVTNGISPRYWALGPFQDVEAVLGLSDDEFLQIDAQGRLEDLRWLAKRQGLGEAWVEDVLSNHRSIILWTRRIVEYKRLEILADILEDPQMREEFLQTGEVFIFGGRMHQDDSYGPRHYKRIQDAIRQDARLQGRVIFFDNYNVWEAPRLFNLADAAVMLADEGQEAAATGFMKAQRRRKLIIASRDGAVPESVKFYGEVGLEEANGFNVPYAYVPVDRDGKQSRIPWQPTAANLLGALKQFGAVYNDKPTLARMMRNALRQAPAVSIERTAQDMLRLFASVVDDAAREQAAFDEGARLTDQTLTDQPLSAQQARGLLNHLMSHPARFLWKYKPNNNKADERILYESPPGLPGFLNGFQHIRTLGTVGVWSLAFHAWNHGELGDIFAHLDDLLKDLPELAHLRDELSRLSQQAQPLPDDQSEERFRLNRIAIGSAERLLRRLKELAAPPPTPPVSSEPEPTPAPASSNFTSIGQTPSSGSPTTGQAPLEGAGERGAGDGEGSTARQEQSEPSRVPDAGGRQRKIGTGK